MSDQQQTSGESSARRTPATPPDAETVAARLVGTGKPRTASTPKAAEPEGAPAGEPEAGAGTDEETRPAPATGRSRTGTTTGDAAAGGAGEADGSEEPSGGEKAGDTASAEVTAGQAEGGTAEGDEAAKGTAESSRGEDATGGNGARALSAAAAGEQHQALAAAVTHRGAAGSTRSAVGRPRKPVLAGAALAGAVLVAVPLLITVTDRDEDRKTVDNAAADTVLNEVNGPAGVFETQTPSPTKTKAGKKAQQQAESPAPVADKPAAPPHKPSPSAGKKKEKAAVKKAPSALPAVMTRVLIKNNTNHTCVDVPGFTSGRPDGPVTHATCNSNTDDNQLWNVEQRYEKAGPGGVPLFQIRNVMDGMCLDLPGYQGVGGATKIAEFPCNGTTKDNQLWWLDKQSDGKFWIRNAASNNQCLDSYAPDDETRGLIIWPCAPEGRNNHEWLFTRS